MTRDVEILLKSSLKQDSSRLSSVEHNKESNHLYRLSCYDSSHGNLSRLLSCHWTARGFDRQTRALFRAPRDPIIHPSLLAGRRNHKVNRIIKTSHRAESPQMNGRSKFTNCCVLDEQTQQVRHRCGSLITLWGGTVRKGSYLKNWLWSGRLKAFYSLHKGYRGASSSLAWHLLHVRGRFITQGKNNSSNMISQPEGVQI